MKATRFLILASVCTLAALDVPAQTSRDEAAVRGLPVAFCEAWAEHDGARLAKIMAPDVDFVTVGGTWLRGRSDFEKYHARLLTGRFRQSTNTLMQSEVRFLGPTSALVHWTWSIQGDRDADGTPRPPRFGLMTMLAAKHRGQWLVAAAQNTNGAATTPPEANGIRSPLSLPAVGGTTASKSATVSEGRGSMRHATGGFDVKVIPQGETDKAPGSVLARMSLDKSFHGDLEGSGKGEMLTAGTDVKGSAAYVAMERITGTLHGRSGSFVLMHNGVMTAASQQLALSVVPDSGSGALVGIAGRMTIVVADGKHSYDLEYSLPAAN